MVSKVVARAGPSTTPSPDVLAKQPLSGADVMGEHGGLGSLREAKCHDAYDKAGTPTPSVTVGAAAAEGRVSSLREAISTIPKR